ncbi:MAG TPA: hypothetical protein VNI78_08935 [Vicinamibacterales bacterium]|nr:hypothetical protein [Vicinamibacterales bacterium]
MEIALVRKQVQRAIAQARERAKRRRERIAEAERAYESFVRDVAAPIARQVAAALKAEGYAVTVSTPGSNVRVSFDHSRDDFIELGLDTEGERPQVIARISRTRGSRRLDEERPVKPDAPPETLTENDVLEFLLGALEPWLAR